MNKEVETISEEQFLHNKLSFEINQELIHLMKRIVQLQQENNYLKLNNPEQNIEHFRIIKENKRKIDNLRKENKELKEDIDKLTSESTEWEDRYYRLQDKWDVSIIELENKNKELHNKIEKAIEYIEWQRVNPQYDNVWRNFECDKLIEILKDSDVDGR